MFERFQGFVSYGCPLDKFATLWPRIVPLNKQTAVFQPGCEWINLHEPTDPVAGCLDAFNAPPPDPQEKSPRKQLPPQNFASRSLWVFLLVAGILLPVALGAKDAEPTVVFPGIIVLGVYLGVTLLSLGFLCELLNRVGDAGMEQLYVLRETSGAPEFATSAGGAA